MASKIFGAANLWKLLLVFALQLLFLLFFSFPNHRPNWKTSLPPATRTNLSHLVFGLLASEEAWHHREAYIQSWWRPEACRGFVYLDKPPTGDLLPWSKASPPYRVSDDLTRFLRETEARAPVMIRMVHGIMEAVRDAGEFRWLVMGDDDSVFFVENMVDVVARYDHRKYYYLGGQSEFIMSNHWYSFDQGFGGAGFILSYPLAKAMVDDMKNCLRRYADVSSADHITMLCIADLGVNLSPQKGIHQIDLRGNISGFLSSHPKSPLMSLHHFDKVDPIFPKMDRFQSTRHLMKAAAADQSRMLQQTICYYRKSNWSFSVSWGYSVHIYENIMPRSYLQKPIETFKPWHRAPTPRPHYMFNTRLPSDDPCEAPHVFFFDKVKMGFSGFLTTYRRAEARGLPPCSSSGNQSADFVSEIHVFSTATKRKEMDRCECCEILGIIGTTAEVRFRECRTKEIIA